MRVAFGSDHGGFGLKGPLMALARSLGHQVIDRGCHSEEATDYPQYAFDVAQQVAAGDANVGVLICGTGIGMSVAANRVPGIRAAAVTDVCAAQLSREHNDANVLCLGGRITEPGTAEEILRVWLATPFSNGERHVRRLRQIHERDTAPDCRAGSEPKP